MNLHFRTPCKRYFAFALLAPNYMRYAFFAGLFSLVVVVAEAAPQAVSPAGNAPVKSAAQFVSISGTISNADTAGKSFTVQTDKGDQVVKFDDRTAFMRIAPGETDLTKATPIQKTDVATGDRVLARVRTGENAGSTPATRIIVITKDELAKRDEKVQQEWATRSITGIVQSVDPGTKQIVIQSRGPQGAHPLTVDTDGKVTFRRYSQESTKAADMKMSSISEINPGDQLRVLGERSEDGNKVKAESIVTGAFRTVGVVVRTIDTAGNTITGIDASTKKPIVIKVTPDSSMRRLQPQLAMMLARQLNPNFSAGGQGARGAGGPGGAGGQGVGARSAGAGNGDGTGQARTAGPPAGGSPGGPGAGGPGGGGPGGMRGGRMDVSRMLESQPATQLAELKPNDALIVYGLAASDLSKLTALNVIAGAEVILTAAPKGGADPLGGNWNFGDMGGPAQ